MGEAPVLPDGRRIGTGFRDALWADQPSLELLDAATGDVPTYLINADVHSVWLNTAALRREGHRTRRRRHPAGSAGVRDLPSPERRRPRASATRWSPRWRRDAASRGVVGLVDLDMAWNESAWARRLDGGFDTLRVEFGIYPEFLERAIAEGLRTGDAVRGAASDLARVGSLKVITDGSLGTRTAACSHAYPGDPHNHGVLDRRARDAARAHDRGHRRRARPARSTRSATSPTPTRSTRSPSPAPSGTIEHAQLVAHADIPRFARLGVGASVQPEHAIDDRDLTDSIWAGQTALPYPLRALADAGANLLFGSDAPVSPLDPWAAMAAAVFRTRDGREPWHPEQGVDAATALGRLDPRRLGAPGRAIEPGRSADLALCERDPLAAIRSSTCAPCRSRRRCSAGRLTHRG